MFVLEKLVKGLTSSSCEVGMTDSYALIVNKINSLNLEALKSDSVYYDVSFGCLLFLYTVLEATVDI